MSECQPLSSGEGTASTTTATKIKCINVNLADKQRYVLRIVASEEAMKTTKIKSIFDELDSINSWKNCKVSINDEVMETFPYQSASNEMVFVTQTAENVIENKITVKCNDKDADIVSVGVFDKVLRYGSQIPEINVKAHESANILFTAMTEMRKIQMEVLKHSDPETRRRLLSNEDELAKFVNKVTRKLNHHSNVGRFMPKIFKNDPFEGFMHNFAPAIPQKNDNAVKKINDDEMWNPFQPFESILDSIFDDDRPFEVTKRETVALDGPELPLKLRFKNDAIENDYLVSKAIALNSDNDESYFEAEDVKQSSLKLSSNVDYVLQFENNQDEDVQFGLESTFVDVFADGMMDFDFDHLLDDFLGETKDDKAEKVKKVLPQKPRVEHEVKKAVPRYNVHEVPYQQVQHGAVDAHKMSKYHVGKVMPRHHKIHHKVRFNQFHEYEPVRLDNNYVQLQESVLMEVSMLSILLFSILFGGISAFMLFIIKRRIRASYAQQPADQGENAEEETAQNYQLMEDEVTVAVV